MGASSGVSRHDFVSAERHVVSCVRGRTVRAFAAASRDMFGEAATRELIATLPEAARADVDEQDWVPAEYVTWWCERAFEGPLGRDPAKLRAWACRMIDHGFGRFRRLLLTIATPAGLVRRAGDLWREEFNQGRLVAYTTSPGSAIASLHDHVFLAKDVTRDLLAETFRYNVELAGGRGAREQHTLHANGALIVELSW